MANQIRGPQRRLFQSRPSGTSAVAAYTHALFSQFEMNIIRAVNTTASAVVISIYHDPDGSTYDQDSALEYNVTLDPYQSLVISDEVVGYKNGETIGVQTDTADAVNFVGYGRVDDETVQP